MSAAAVLITAAAYAALGLVALQLAIPPGYSVAFWPSAGLALVMTVRYGAPAVLGAGCGSFLANLAVPGCTPDLAAVIGCGAAIQAWLGGACIRKWAPGWNNGQAVRAMGVGMATCVNAVLGPAALYMFGALSPDQWVSSGAVWAFGDAVGVACVLPVAAALSSGSKRRYAVALPAAMGLVLAYGISASSLLTSFGWAFMVASSGLISAASCIGLSLVRRV